MSYSHAVMFFCRQAWAHVLLSNVHLPPDFLFVTLSSVFLKYILDLSLLEPGNQVSISRPFEI